MRNLIGLATILCFATAPAAADTFTVKAFQAVEGAVSPHDVRDIAEDTRGFIYVADSSGVLEFDGVQWRANPTRNRISFRSVVSGTYTGDDGLSIARKPYWSTAGSGSGSVNAGASQPALPQLASAATPSRSTIESFASPVATSIVA